MARRLRNSEDMEIESLHNDLKSLKQQMQEVIMILGGSASYDYKGMRSDVKELKTDMYNIKAEIEKIKTDRGFISISIKTIPQRIAAIIACTGGILVIVQSVKTLFLER